MNNHLMTLPQPACAALEDAAEAMLAGRGPGDLVDPAIYPKDGTHGS